MIQAKAQAGAERSTSNAASEDFRTPAMPAVCIVETSTPSWDVLVAEDGVEAVRCHLILVLRFTSCVFF